MDHLLHVCHLGHLLARPLAAAPTAHPAARRGAAAEPRPRLARGRGRGAALNLVEAVGAGEREVLVRILERLVEARGGRLREEAGGERAWEARAE